MSKFNEIFNKKEIDKKSIANIKDFSFISKTEDEDIEAFDQGQLFMVDIPEYIQKKAELISAHFLLPEGSRLVDTGCGTGQVTYLLAKLNPRVEVIGIGKNKRAVDFANKYYHLPNLKFIYSDLFIDDVEDNSVDGIISSNVLYGVYSASGYNPDEVSAMLEKQVRKLKPGGTMVIRDYLMPEEDEMVLMEFPNIPSSGKKPEQLSDADLLILFSQSARPLPGGGFEGFFIQELPPKEEGTRLFRLPHKWAIEFVHHKDERATWNKSIKMEYTFFTHKDYRREFAKMGMRVVFSAPYWNPWVVKNRFDGKFKMYTEDYRAKANPATNYFVVAQKTAGKQSLLLEERRPSQNPAGDLNISLVRDGQSGKLFELASPAEDICDIIPFRITPDNRLVVYVRTGVPRPIVNAVSRGSQNLDEKRWSGHLIEPITMDLSSIGGDAEQNRLSIYDYLNNTIGLRGKSNHSWYVGNAYMPAPDKIDAVIEPVFIQVENPYKTMWPLNGGGASGFSEEGRVIELDGNDIILASQVGLLPEPRLEMHVIDLMQRYKIPMPNWVGDSIPEMLDPTSIKPDNTKDVIEKVAEVVFSEEKGMPIQLRAVKSTFVEDGKVGSTTRGIAGKDVEFVVTNDGVENVAIVLPMTKDWEDNLLVALEPQVMPVPNRRGGDGVMLNAPSFPLPKDVRTMEEAKEFVAKKFFIPVENVTQLGESYFSYVGLTPQRIYPFAIMGIANPEDDASLTCVRMDALYAVPFERYSSDTLRTFARAQMSLDSNNSMSLKQDMSHTRYKGFSIATEKVAMDARNNRQSVIPSRILGEVEKPSLGSKIKNTLDGFKPGS